LRKEIATVGDKLSGLSLSGCSRREGSNGAVRTSERNECQIISRLIIEDVSTRIYLKNPTKLHRLNVSTATEANIAPSRNHEEWRSSPNAHASSANHQYSEHPCCHGGHQRDLREKDGKDG
jgi:hypothetical protein